MSDSITRAAAPGEHDEHVQHGSLRGYLTGFALAAILTIIPFWLVMGRPVDSVAWTIFLVLGLAVVQIFVHIVYFLHLDTRSEGGWNMLAFLFSAVLVVIVLGASIWVMFTENKLMMPMHQQETTQPAAQHSAAPPPMPSMRQ